MFEVMKRFGKSLKYGLQFILGIYVLVGIFQYEGATFFSALFAIVLIETFSRVTVWIISGYYETNPRSKINPLFMKQMRDYYRCVKLVKKIAK